MQRDSWAAVREERQEKDPEEKKGGMRRGVQRMSKVEEESQGEEKGAWETLVRKAKESLPKQTVGHVGLYTSLVNFDHLAFIEIVSLCVFHDEVVLYSCLLSLDPTCSFCPAFQLSPPCSNF